MNITPFHNRREVSNGIRLGSPSNSLRNGQVVPVIGPYIAQLGGLAGGVIKKYPRCPVDLCNIAYTGLRHRGVLKVFLLKVKVVGANV